MEKSLEAQLGEALTARGWRLALAESCTGGLVGHRVTEVPGSSVYFLGGIIAYANEAKMKQLGVNQATLQAHGAVSAETALEMASGARQAFDCEVGASVTGIAGPRKTPAPPASGSSEENSYSTSGALGRGGGGSGEKPVGLTFVGVATPEGERVERYIFDGDRQANKESAAEVLLQLLLDMIS